MERKYNMCDVALPAMSGRALATLVSAEVVMTGGDTTVTHGSILPGAALPSANPGHARPRPDQEHGGRGEGGQQQKHLNRYGDNPKP